jgi:hypothetical protein
MIKQKVKEGKAIFVIITPLRLALCLTKHHAMKTYWGGEGDTSHILNLST